VADAVHDVDQQIGRLVTGLQQLNLPVDIIVLADHGMAKVEAGAVQLDEYGLKTATFEKIIGLSLYPKTDADAESAYETLRGKSGRFLVYRRADVPGRLHFDTNPRAGDPIVVAPALTLFVSAQIFRGRSAFRLARMVTSPGAYPT
jgi:predicted AlkP superfamily pyrophosphatase or phosphodiesterase